MAQADFKVQTESLRQELIARRRDFHLHPELAFEKCFRAGTVPDELQKLGLEVQTAVGKAGSAFKFIPQDIIRRGTIRKNRQEVHEMVDQRMRETCEGVAQAMGCSVDFQSRIGALPVRDDPIMSAQVRNLVQKYVDTGGLLLDDRTTGAEDVGVFMDGIPGMYFLLGAADPNQHQYYGHHHTRFDFDENAPPFGVARMSAAVAEYVLPGA